MLINFAGLTAECEINSEEQVRTRMLLIAEGLRRKIPPSNVIIVDKVDGVYYEVIDGFETKKEIPL